MTKTKFGLRVKGSNKILGYTLSTPEVTELGVEISYYLDSSGQFQNWLVDTAEEAEYVKYNSASAYGATYEKPVNHYDYNELEIVEITITTEEKRYSEKEKFLVRFKHEEFEFNECIVSNIHHNNATRLPIRLFQGKEILVEEHGEFYKIIKILKGTQSLYLYRYVKKTDFEKII